MSKLNRALLQKFPFFNNYELRESFLELVLSDQSSVKSCDSALLQCKKCAKMKEVLYYNRIGSVNQKQGEHLCPPQ